MREHSAHSVLLRDVLWRRLDEPAFEHCRLQQLTGAYDLQGCVLTVVAGAPLQVRYVIRCGLDWITREAQVNTMHGSSSGHLHLRRDVSGVWWRDQERVPNVDGLLDIDLSISPSTNTLPIRRMALDIGAAGPVEAVWVRFPDLALERLAQRYTRERELLYSYESNGGAFTAEIQVDEHGVVVSYGSMWERIATGQTSRRLGV